MLVFFKEKELVSFKDGSFQYEILEMEYLEPYSDKPTKYYILVKIVSYKKQVMFKGTYDECYKHLKELI